MCDSGILKNPVLRILEVFGMECTEAELQQLQNQSASINPSLRLDLDTH
jgi:hypothetical protein